MKKKLFVYLLVSALMSFIFTITNAQTPAQNLKTLETRVNNTGEIPDQAHYNLIIDKMKKYFYDGQWKDEIVSMKWIKVLPPNDPKDWYWFISLRTKNCSSPFYISYDIHDSNLGEIFFVEHVWPIEYKAYLDKLRANLPLSKMDAAGRREIANKYFPIIKKRLRDFIKDTILVSVTKDFQSKIESISMNYPESNRDEKKQEIWAALNSGKYKESILNIKSDELVSAADIESTLDNWRDGSLERAINIYVHNCQELLWRDAAGVKFHFQPILTSFSQIEKPSNKDERLEKVLDKDGNEYKVVKIGNQFWMGENLKTTKYSNGKPIPNVTGDNWDSLTTDAYCWYNNDSTNKNLGAIYNFYTITDSCNVCPDGWHVPTISEWTTLINYLGGDIDALKKVDPSFSNTNSSNFTAIPGGYRVNEFNKVKAYWSSSSFDNEVAWIRFFNWDRITQNKRKKSSGISIRCLKNEISKDN